MSKDLKSKTVSALQWNTIDKIFVQICYSVTGIILANILFPEDMALVAFLNAFLAFANVFVDGGLSNALIQKQNVTRKDYDTVFIFNITICTLLYIILYFCAPVIASFYEDERLITLSRVMFLNLFFSSFGIIQTSILMKEMNMKKLSLVNVVSLLIASAGALVVVFNGFGVWALVFQPLVFTLCKTLILWISSKWRPRFKFSFESLRNFFSFSTHMLLTKFTNTFFNNINQLVIGIRYEPDELGYYSQAEKWSSMGANSLSQIIGYSSFPALSSIQDDKERMQRIFGKMNRATSYLSFPAFIGLIIVAQPLFHCLFGTKWDASVFLFQLLLVRGFFFVFSSLLNNYLMAIGNTRIIFRLEVLKDIVLLITLFITIQISIPALVIGQVICGGLHYVLTTFAVKKYAGYTVKRQLYDMFPYFSLSLIMAFALLLLSLFITNFWVLLIVQMVTGAVLYFGMNKLFNSRIQEEILDTLRGKLKSKN